MLSFVVRVVYERRTLLPALQEDTDVAASAAPAPTLDHTYVTTASSVTSSTQIVYELVGIVVHSGQANAGHYYSYIKDRK